MGCQVTEYHEIYLSYRSRNIQVVVGEKASREDHLKSLCKSKELKELLMNELENTATSFKLAGFEYVKNIHVEPEEFTLENGLLTPTFKLKRAGIIITIP